MKQRINVHRTMNFNTKPCTTSNSDQGCKCDSVPISKDFNLSVNLIDSQTCPNTSDSETMSLCTITKAPEITTATGTFTKSIDRTDVTDTSNRDSTCCNVETGTTKYHMSHLADSKYDSDQTKDDITQLNALTSTIHSENVNVDDCTIDSEHIPNLNFVDLPETSHDLLILNDCFMMIALSVYEMLRRFSVTLKLSHFLFEDFCACLLSTVISPLLCEIHISLLRLLHRDNEENGIVFTHNDLKSSYDVLFLIGLDFFTWPAILLRFAEGSHWSEDVISILNNDYPHCSYQNRLKILEFLTNSALDTTQIRSSLNNFETGLQQNKQQFLQIEDRCRICSKRTNLYKCARCFGAFHIQCVYDEMKNHPMEDWICPVCVASEVRGISDCQIYKLDVHGTRMDPLGFDVYGNCYYFTVRRLFIESPNGKVRYYSSSDKISELINYLIEHNSSTNNQNDNQNANEYCAFAQEGCCYPTIIDNQGILDQLTKMQIEIKKDMQMTLLLTDERLQKLKNSNAHNMSEKLRQSYFENYFKKFDIKLNMDNDFSLSYYHYRCLSPWTSPLSERSSFQDELQLQNISQSEKIDSNSHYLNDGHLSSIVSDNISLDTFDHGSATLLDSECAAVCGNVNDINNSRLSKQNCTNIESFSDNDSKYPHQLDGCFDHDSDADDTLMTDFTDTDDNPSSNETAINEYPCMDNNSQSCLNRFPEYSEQFESSKSSDDGSNNFSDSQCRNSVGIKTSSSPLTDDTRDVDSNLSKQGDNVYSYFQDNINREDTDCKMFQSDSLSSQIVTVHTNTCTTDASSPKCLTNQPPASFTVLQSEQSFNKNSSRKIKRDLKLITDASNSDVQRRSTRIATGKLKPRPYVQLDKGDISSADESHNDAMKSLQSSNRTSSKSCTRRRRFTVQYNNQTFAATKDAQSSLSLSRRRRKSKLKSANLKSPGGSSTNSYYQSSAIEGSSLQYETSESQQSTTTTNTVYSSTSVAPNTPKSCKSNTYSKSRNKRSTVINKEVTLNRNASNVSDLLNTSATVDDVPRPLPTASLLVRCDGTSTLLMEPIPTDVTDCSELLDSDGEMSTTITDCRAYSFLTGKDETADLLVNMNTFLKDFESLISFIGLGSTSDLRNLLQSCSGAYTDSSLMPIPYTSIDPNHNDGLYRLGDDCTYLHYINPYVTHDYCQSRSSYNYDREKKNLLSRRYTVFPVFDWGLDQLKLSTSDVASRRKARFEEAERNKFNELKAGIGQRSHLLRMACIALLALECQIPPSFMHRAWHIERVNWAKEVASCCDPRRLALLLRLFENAIKPITFNSIYFHGLAAVNFYKETLSDREERKKEEINNRKRIESDIASFTGNVPKGIKSSLWRVRGEEYRLLGGGWYWNRRNCKLRIPQALNKNGLENVISAGRKIHRSVSLCSQWIHSLRQNFDVVRSRMLDRSTVDPSVIETMTRLYGQDNDLTVADDIGLDGNTIDSFDRTLKAYDEYAFQSDRKQIWAMESSFFKDSVHPLLAKWDIDTIDISGQLCMKRLNESGGILDKFTLYSNSARVCSVLDNLLELRENLQSNLKRQFDASIQSLKIRVQQDLKHIDKSNHCLLHHVHFNNPEPNASSVTAAIEIRTDDVQDSANNACAKHEIDYTSEDSNLTNCSYVTAADIEERTQTTVNALIEQGELSLDGNVVLNYNNDTLRLPLCVYDSKLPFILSTSKSKKINVSQNPDSTIPDNYTSSYFSKKDFKPSGLFDLPKYLLQKLARNSVRMVIPAFKDSRHISWPYPCGKPVQRTVWQWHTSSAHLISEVALQLKLLFCSLSISTIEEVTNHAHTNEAFINASHPEGVLINRREIGPTGICSEYLFQQNEAQSKHSPLHGQTGKTDHKSQGEWIHESNLSPLQIHSFNRSKEHANYLRLQLWRPPFPRSINHSPNVVRQGNACDQPALLNQYVHDKQYTACMDYPATNLCDLNKYSTKSENEPSGDGRSNSLPAAPTTLSVFRKRVDQFAPLPSPPTNIFAKRLLKLNTYSNSSINQQLNQQLTTQATKGQIKINPLSSVNSSVHVIPINTQYASNYSQKFRNVTTTTYSLINTHATQKQQPSLYQSDNHLKQQSLISSSLAVANHLCPQDMTPIKKISRARVIVINQPNVGKIITPQQKCSIKKASNDDLAEVNDDQSVMKPVHSCLSVLDVKSLTPHIEFDVNNQRKLIITVGSKSSKLISVE
ncbi:hypothetical protein GJ496_007738 [Pomphorhynchus laevis]|nr:hypothetical protein GJ496_007738 [Pomphorhynchus laevis]